MIEAAPLIPARPGAPGARIPRSRLQGNSTHACAGARFGLADRSCLGWVHARGSRSLRGSPDPPPHYRSSSLPPAS